jgi:hypothetical protein
MLVGMARSRSLRIQPRPAVAVCVLLWSLCFGACGDNPTADRENGSDAGSEPAVVHRDWSVPMAAPGAPPYGDALHARLERALATRPAGYRPRTEHLNDAGSPRFTNRLILETSPYLLQHAHNPVDWHPWGDEAFEIARELDRPVLLSIGYSTCHWCHVMERESFEDLEIARFLNEHYVCIKVDREERPDVDAVYMDAVRMLSGSGGWPMTAIVTPDGEAFFGGTYFPARDGDRGARMGFLTILQRIAQGYAADRETLVAAAADLTRRLQAMSERTLPGDVPGSAAIARVVAQLSLGFDDVHGGFGGAPKFPRSVVHEMLLRHHRRTDDETALHMAVYTLERMAAGGIYDQVGGGFHRYSTDARWLVPHFEKMLYDNALLAVAYLEAYQVTGDEDLARIAVETLDYVAREMTAPEGGFHSATDADSPAPDGHEEEGRFFTWTLAELQNALDPESLSLVRDYYGVTDEGNFEGRNVLYARRDLDLVARERSIGVEEARRRVDAARARLYEQRSLRPPPAKDTKVLTSWNGLMISAFARAALALGIDEYRRRAESAAAFLIDEMWDGRELKRSWREGRARHDGVLDDYAFLTAGLLDLFEATGEAKWLRTALDLNEALEARFWDGEHGGYYFTAADAEQLLVRDKPTYDGAEPSGNSIAMINLLRFYELTGDERYLALVEAALRAFSSVVSNNGLAVPEMLTALDFYLDTPKEIVLVRASDDDDFDPFLLRLGRTFLPNRVLLTTTEGAGLDELAELVPLVADKRALDDLPTAYVCERRVCELPTTDPEVFAAQISRVRPYIDVSAESADD